MKTITKNTKKMIKENASGNGFFFFLNESSYNAQSWLLKKEWRKRQTPGEEIF